MVGRPAVVNAPPDRLPGQRVEDVRLEQVQGQPLLVDPGVQQAGEQVGPVGGHRDASDLGVEHPPDPGDGALDPHPPVDRGDQVEAAG